MKQLLTIFAFTFFASQASAQVSQAALTGTWAIVGVEAPEQDTIALFKNDTAVEKALKDKMVVTKEDLSKKHPEKLRMVEMLQGQIGTSFMQFSGTNLYAEGLAKDEKFKEAQSVKSGNFLVSADGLVLTIVIIADGMTNTQFYNVNMHNGIMMVSSQTSPEMVVYMKKISAGPVFKS